MGAAAAGHKPEGAGREAVAGGVADSSLHEPLHDTHSTLSLGLTELL